MTHQNLSLLQTPGIPTHGPQSVIDLAWGNTNSHEGRSFAHYHKDRDLERKTPIYVSYVKVFADDASGNTSKQWNKFENQYLSHRNLPREMVSMQTHVHFVSASQKLFITNEDPPTLCATCSTAKIRAAISRRQRTRREEAPLLRIPFEILHIARNPRQIGIVSVVVENRYISLNSIAISPTSGMISALIMYDILIMENQF